MVSDAPRTQFITGFATKDVSKLATGDPVTATHQQQQQQNSHPGIPKIARRHPDRPLFIIHPGPPKTATTTIQNGLKEFRPQLWEDGFLFPGMMDGHKGGVYEPAALSNLQDRRCQQRLVHNETSECWQDFLRELQRLHQANTSIIISDERLAEMWWDIKVPGKPKEPTRVFWPALQKAFAVNWDVRVLLSYRRIEDWLPSVKAEYDRMNGNRKWPASGKREMQPLFPHVMSLLHDVEDGNGRYKGIETLRASYERHFPNSTVIWDLATAREHGGVLPTLLCDILDGASSACNSSLSKEIQSTNAKKDNEMHRIVGQAAVEGLINTTTTRLSRQQAAGKLYQFHTHKLQLTDKDWPLQCPNRTVLEEVLSASLALEDRLLEVTKEVQDTHIAGFWKGVAANKYCSVNATAVVRNQTYATFFASLS
ncbi:MAG: hypothetical protein SGILL_006660 [Bacillariaceae sp.]